jgi:hypothetical protein
LAGATRATCGTSRAGRQRLSEEHSIYYAARYLCQVNLTLPEKPANHYPTPATPQTAKWQNSEKFRNFLRKLLYERAFARFSEFYHFAHLIPKKI